MITVIYTVQDTLVTLLLLDTSIRVMVTGGIYQDCTSVAQKTMHQQIEQRLGSCLFLICRSMYFYANNGWG